MRAGSAGAVRSGRADAAGPQVRDTFEVPKSGSRLTSGNGIGRWGRFWPGWARTWAYRRECSLVAEFHAMLVYGPGQFFAPHQDSEKADDMIGTLVVMLPSVAGRCRCWSTTAGRPPYRSSKTSLTFVAFYADCRHRSSR